MRTPIAPILVSHLFAPMRAELIAILENLDDAQWQLPTACDGWSVKDVALHIFADDCGYLSRRRDDDGITFKTDSFDELISKFFQLIGVENAGCNARKVVV